MNTHLCSPGDNKAMGEEGRGLSSDGGPGCVCVVSEIGLEKESGFIEKLLGTVLIRRFVLERGDIGA